MAPEAKRPLFKTFQRNFEESYGSAPGVMEVRAYEAVDVLVHLIDNYRVRDRVQLKKSLDHVKDHPGVTGPISVDIYGKWRKPVYLFTVMDGEFIVIWQTVVGPGPEADSEGQSAASAAVPESAARP
jgi:ABC-type branched-subunit amino acid transport system substrate-binding protein